MNEHKAMGETMNEVMKETVNKAMKDIMKETMNDAMKESRKESPVGMSGGSVAASGAAVSPSAKPGRKGLALALTGFFSWLLFMLASLPAAVVYRYAPVPEFIRLSGLSGTFWQGRAEAVVVDGLLLPEVRWSINPLSFISQKLVADFTLGNLQTPLSAQGQLELTDTRVKLSNLQGDVEASWLQTRLGKAIPAPVSVSGVITLALEQGAFDANGCTRLTGQLGWQRGIISNPYGQLPLGQAQAVLDCRNGALQAEISQSSPALSLDGQLSLEPRGRYQFSARLKPGAQMPDPLRQGLPLFSQTGADGRYVLNWSGLF